MWRRSSHPCNIVTMLLVKIPVAADVVVFTLVARGGVVEVRYLIVEPARVHHADVERLERVRNVAQVGHLAGEPREWVDVNRKVVDHRRLLELARVLDRVVDVHGDVGVAQHDGEHEPRLDGHALDRHRRAVSVDGVHAHGDLLGVVDGAHGDGGRGLGDPAGGVDVTLHENVLRHVVCADDGREVQPDRVGELLAGDGVVGPLEVCVCGFIILVERIWGVSS